jgi:2,3-bisphosphoglycerate-dependent phosphoglycerate mutase
LTTFYLVRHAHSEWEPNENRPLSVYGLEDAKRVADVLQNYPVRAIYSSPERRAFQTISPLAEQLGIQIEIEAALRERKLGNEVFEDFFGAVEATWRDPSFAHPGGESSVEAQNRGLTVVKQLQSKHPNEAVVLSTHGNLMALILQTFDPSIDFAFWKSLTMPDIYQLTIKQACSGSIKRLWTSAAK